MRAVFIGILLASVVVAGCASNAARPGASPSPPITGLDSKVPNGTVRFVVLGDVGTGEAGEQDEVAGGVVQVCQRLGCNFIMVAGDNIYDAGASSVDDPQFKTKFEDMYRSIDLPFYLVLGNHDNGGGSGQRSAVGDYQVEYSKKSAKWHMPGRNYAQQIGAVTIVGIDSGPAEVTVSPVWAPGTRGASTQDWLAKETPKIATKWRFAFAHHAYWSNGPHGDAGAFDNVAGRGLFYKRLLESEVCAKYDVFFAAHDHTLQWLKPSDTCPKTELIISGAGGADLYAKRAAGTHPAYFEDYRHHGFWFVDVTGNTFTATAFDEKGAPLFERTMTRNAATP
jgi:hypothetical protein